jgi:hypothetical protein
MDAAVAFAAFEAAESIMPLVNVEASDKVCVVS